MYEASFRLLSTGNNLLASGTDVVAFGVSFRAGENFERRQLWSAPTSIMLRSLDGAYFEYVEPHGRWVSYIGRPMVVLDVITVRVDLTNPKEVLLKYAINGKYGARSIRRVLPTQPDLQVHLAVEYFAVGAEVEIL